VVAVAVAVVAAVGVASRPTVRRRLESVALTVRRAISGAVEPGVVAELARLAARVVSGEEAADVGTRGRRVRRVDVPVAHIVDEIAAVVAARRDVVVASFLRATVVAVQFRALSGCVHRGPEERTAQWRRRDGHSRQQDSRAMRSASTKALALKASPQMSQTALPNISDPAPKT